MNDSPSSRPLRILAIVSLPWDPRLGAARVMTDLVEEWRAAGHVVETYCLTDAYPDATRSRRLSSLRFTLFPKRAADYVRRHGHRFDVIDALIGTLPFSADSLGFRGLLVARSVGLHRLYHRFDDFSRRRWPGQEPRRFPANIFYGLLMRRLRRNAETAIRLCHLLNLPNDSEETELRKSAAGKSILVQPYGLRETHRDALGQAAASAERRLRSQQIVFVGQWSLRKGAGDWNEIIRRIRVAAPNARFKFVGTMKSADAILKHLDLPSSIQMEIVPEFDPAELPALLAEATVGIFPSYVEGFGIAVLEQLAAGLPTIAYDVPGPREILEPQRANLLSPLGDPAELASRALSVLQMDATTYAALSVVCQSLASRYRCAEIAATTARRYATELAQSNRNCLVFTQPFALASPGGGPRILRSLLQDAPWPVVSFCTASAAPTHPYRDEHHIPIRPNYGRLERTRLSGFAHRVTPLFARRFRRRLQKEIAATGARGLHAIAHGGLDFYETFRIARQFRLPFFLQVHDDVVYTGAGRVSRAKLENALAETWLGATARFVISRELGLEYQRRYGNRDFIVITDGLDEVAPAPRPRTGRLRIYFMGLFHIGYEENLQALIQAMELLRPECTQPNDCSITLRCDYLRPALQRQSPLVRVLPFGSEADVQADLADADALYLPLHFAKADEPFGAYSLSTKMVTYLGSGLPILYHGPAGTAAERMLREYAAAFFATSLQPSEIAETLRDLWKGDQTIRLTENALQLARRNFLRADQHRRFWETVTHGQANEKETTQ